MFRCTRAAAWRMWVRLRLFRSLFNSRVRLTGVALGFNLATIATGGQHLVTGIHSRRIVLIGLLTLFSIRTGGARRESASHTETAASVARR